MHSSVYIADVRHRPKNTCIVPLGSSNFRAVNWSAVSAEFNHPVSPRAFSREALRRCRLVENRCRAPVGGNLSSSPAHHSCSTVSRKFSLEGEHVLSKESINCSSVRVCFVKSLRLQHMRTCHGVVPAQQQCLHVQRCNNR